MEHRFGEKNAEYSRKQGKEIPVWKTPQYDEAKKKAIEAIESGKYGLTDADFWILMNESKSGKMMYTGLIIKHNGCLKINDTLENKFNPGSMSCDKDGFGGSLVYTYCNNSQGIYEVGEVSKDNCLMAYPYAMALKRCFDRVVLKLSKLAYAGIYSEAEADEFKQPEPEEKKTEKAETKEEPKMYQPESPAEEIKKLAKELGIGIKELFDKHNVFQPTDLTPQKYAEMKAYLLKEKNDRIQGNT